MTDLTELEAIHKEWIKQTQERLDKEKNALPLAGGCGDNCACSRPQEESKPDWISNDEFVARYAQALNSFLEEILSNTKHHKEDLAAHAAVFGEALHATLVNFL